MDRYETRMREDIAACDEYIERLRAEIDAQRVRKGALEHALSVYAETQSRGAPQRGGRSRPGSYSSRVLEVLRSAGAQGLATKELYQKLEEAGHGVRAGNIRSLLYERRKSGIVERLGDGRHRFVSSSANGDQREESEATTDASSENEVTTDASETSAGDAASTPGTLLLTPSRAGA